MNQPIINFAHANGFPAKVYSKLFRLLASEYEVIFKNLYGHTKQYPIQDSWMKTGEEIVEFITSSTKQKVIGIGHSFGATSTLNAAFLKPDLFKGIILIEPVLMNGWKETFFSKLATKLDLVHHFSPGKKTRGRRTHWPDLESAAAYFKSKRLFKDFDEECLSDFLKHGLKKVDDGFELVFDVDVELQIFDVLPHHTDRYKKQLWDIPGVIIAATNTNISTPPRMQRLAKQQNFELEIVEGRHMIPLEQPEFMVDLIRKYAKTF